MSKEKNLILLGLLLNSCSPRLPSTLTSAHTPLTHEQIPTSESIPTLTANEEGLLQWKSGCILHPAPGPLTGVIEFSSDHRAVDFFKDSLNHPAVASLSGTVVFSGQSMDGGGISVVTETPIDDGMFIQARYAHLESTAIPKSSSIRQGEQLGIIGSTRTTGRSKVPHLHFQIFITNWPFDQVVFDSFSIRETVERKEEMENKFGERQIEWVDPLDLIQDICK